jgi:c(7)-type cytochrome triheme protein
MKLIIIIMGSLLLLSSIIFSDSLSLKLTIPETDIIFSHKFHVGEQELECEVCHISIFESNNSASKNLPTMDECANCHEVEDDENCTLCHKNVDEYSELVNPNREIIFNHSLHINMDLSCDVCHGEISESEQPNIKYMPSKANCYSCHDNTKASQNCNICHSSGISVVDIHPIGWENTHGEQAVLNESFCSNCHIQESFCIDCHRGDNKTGNIHDLNYFFTHGLDAKSSQKDCQRCHNNNQFCVTCHEQGMRLPLNHSKLNWLLDHGQAAKTDIENCAACHETSDPTCARAGCHSDFDGILGTDSQIHLGNNGQFQSEGPWHGDDGYYCYQCHVPSRNLPSGFCGYCHSYSGGQ